MRKAAPPSKKTVAGTLVKYFLEGLMLGSGMGPDRSYRFQEFALYVPHRLFLQTDTNSAVSVSLELANGRLGHRERADVPRKEVCINVLGVGPVADTDYRQFLEESGKPPYSRRASETVQVPRAVVNQFSATTRLLPRQCPDYLAQLVAALPAIETSTRAFSRPARAAKAA